MKKLTALVVCVSMLLSAVAMGSISVGAGSLTRQWNKLHGGTTTIEAQGNTYTFTVENGALKAGLDEKVSLDDFSFQMDASDVLGDGTTKDPKAGWLAITFSDTKNQGVFGDQGKGFTLMYSAVAKGGDGHTWFSVKGMNPFVDLHSGVMAAARFGFDTEKTIYNTIRKNEDGKHYLFVGAAQEWIGQQGCCIEDGKKPVEQWIAGKTDSVWNAEKNLTDIFPDGKAYVTIQTVEDPAGAFSGTLTLTLLSDVNADGDSDDKDSDEESSGDTENSEVSQSSDTSQAPSSLQPPKKELNLVYFENNTEVTKKSNTEYHIKTSGGFHENYVYLNEKVSVDGFGIDLSRFQGKAGWVTVMLVGGDKAPKNWSDSTNADGIAWLIFKDQFLPKVDTAFANLQFSNRMDQTYTGQPIAVKMGGDEELKNPLGFSLKKEKDGKFYQFIQNGEIKLSTGNAAQPDWSKSLSDVVAAKGKSFEEMFPDGKAWVVLTFDSAEDFEMDVRFTGGVEGTTDSVETGGTFPAIPLTAAGVSLFFICAALLIRRRSED